MRSLDQIIDSLPADRRAKVTALGQKLITEEWRCATYGRPASSGSMPEGSRKRGRRSNPPAMK